MSWSERPELEAAAVAAAEDEEKEESGRRSWRSGGAGGAGGAAETAEDRRREERKRRSRWIEADATKTKAMMAEMMRRLGLRDTEEEEDDEVVVVVEPRGSVGGKCLRGLSEGEGGGVGLRGGGGDAIWVKAVRRRGFAGVL